MKEISFVRIVSINCTIKASLCWVLGQCHVLSKRNDYKLGFVFLQILRKSKYHTLVESEKIGGLREKKFPRKSQKSRKISLNKMF